MTYRAVHECLYTAYHSIVQHTVPAWKCTQHWTMFTINLDNFESIYSIILNYRLMLEC